MNAAPESTRVRLLADQIVDIERAALRQWCKGNPSGFLEICSDDVVYFDPYIEKRIVGLEALTAYFEGIRGKIEITRFAVRDPFVQLTGSVAVLTFHLDAWGEEEEPSRWNCTEVFRWSGDAWQLTQSHWSRTKRACI